MCVRVRERERVIERKRGEEGEGGEMAGRERENKQQESDKTSQQSP